MLMSTHTMQALDRERWRRVKASYPRKTAQADRDRNAAVPAATLVARPVVGAR